MVKLEKLRPHEHGIAHEREVLWKAGSRRVHGAGTNYEHKHVGVAALIIVRDRTSHKNKRDHMPCDRRLLRFHLIFCPVSVAISSLNMFTPKTSFDPSGSGNSVSSHHSKIQTLNSLLNPRGCRYRTFEACKRTL